MEKSLKGGSCCHSAGLKIAFQKRMGEGPPSSPGPPSISPAAHLRLQEDAALLFAPSLDAFSLA
jgi:hypothetical protein